MKIFLNKELKSLFYKFDLANKGYLTKIEFECFCYSILRKPFLNKSKVFLEDIENLENKDKDLRGLFYHISEGDSIISKDKLRLVCAEIGFPKEKVEILTGSFPKKDYLEIEDFEKIFR